MRPRTKRALPRTAAWLAATFGLALAAATAVSARGYHPPAGFIGYEPDSLLERLEKPDSADIARACGNIAAPWAYRGRLGRLNSMRSYGRHHADGAEARRLADFLMRATTIDTATKVPSTSLPCDPAQAKPVYLVSFHGRGRDTFALLRFDLAAAQFFDAEEPLGMVRMGADGDSLWATLRDVVDDDPLLRGDRPHPAAEPAAVSFTGDFTSAYSLPEAIKKVRPSYPAIARAREIEGLVTIQALVGSDGAVKDAFVVSGHPVFRDDALEAVWQWRFKAASHHGEPIAVWVIVPVNFTLQ